MRTSHRIGTRGRGARWGWSARYTADGLALAVALGLLLVAPPLARAAPDARSGAAPSARPTSLGAGTYEITATVFGTPGDDGASPGHSTSSGHVLQTNDHLVALPACTESSCPWLGFDQASNDSQWGPNTGCIEDDGLCWVELVSPDTGDCTVAPVLDVGPLFRRDNWWWPDTDRNYALPQGVPAATAAIQGEDLGYGPGITDAGYDISGDRNAPGIDIAAGTWEDLGLDPAQGVADVRVTLLWQAGITHDEACGGGNGGAGGGGVTGSGDTATTTDRVNLRSGPSVADDVLDVIPAGSDVQLTGDQVNGYVAVSYQGEDGWVYQAYLSGGNVPASGGTADVTSALNLRSGPSASDDVLALMPGGASVGLTGDSANGYLSVSYQGTEGWAAASYLAATTTDRLNLRADPSADADVLLVMPAGATVQLTGQASNGYVSVSFAGEDGWAYVSFLSG